MNDHYFNRFHDSTNVRVLRVRQRLVHAVLQFCEFVAPRLTGWLTLCLFFSPAAYRANTEEKDCLKQGRPFQVQVHDKTVQAWRWGRGPAILMVHGWSGRGVQFHRFVAPLVQAGYTVVAIDGPAHGASSGRITSYFEFTDTIRTFLTTDLDFNIQGIIGHSFGASAAINALAKEGLFVNAVCIAPVLKLRDLLLYSFRRFGIPQTLVARLIGKFEQRFGYHLEADDPHLLIGDLKGPVLIVHDQQDRTAAFGDSIYQAQMHGHINILATRGLGHRRILTDPAVVQACLEHMDQAKRPIIQTLTA